MIALQHDPDNSEMDNIALDYGLAIHLRTADYGKHVVVTTRTEADLYRSAGWKVVGNINRDDFCNHIGQEPLF